MERNRENDWENLVQKFNYIEMFPNIQTHGVWNRYFHFPSVLEVSQIKLFKDWIYFCGSPSLYFFFSKIIVVLCQCSSGYANEKQ